MIKHTIRLLAPMSHGDFGASSGNVQRFRRIPILSPKGVPIYVPALSAGALRGVVRRILWRDVFDRCGLSRETVTGWDRLYAALANGGTIEAAEKRISPDVIRRRRAEMPVLSLLGAALYTSHMAGRAAVSNSWLACRENPLTPDAPPMREQLADESRVRHVDAEEQDVDVSHVKPMPTTTETVMAGACLMGHANIPAELEASAWSYGLERVRYLGGKAGAGFGEVDIEHDGDGASYTSWLGEHIEPLTASLRQLCAELQR